MTQPPPTVASVVLASHVLHLIIEENSGIGHYDCPLCGSRITSDDTDHDPACRYAEYLRLVYPSLFSDE